MTAHWGIRRSAAAQGSEAEVALAFTEAYRMLSRRIELFVALPLDKLDGMTIRSRLRDIGRIGEAVTTP